MHLVILIPHNVKIFPQSNPSSSKSKKSTKTNSKPTTSDAKIRSYRVGRCCGRRVAVEAPASWASEATSSSEGPDDTTEEPDSSAEASRESG